MAKEVDFQKSLIHDKNATYTSVNFHQTSKHNFITIGLEKKISREHPGYTAAHTP